MKSFSLLDQKVAGTEEEGLDCAKKSTIGRSRKRDKVKISLKLTQKIKITISMVDF